MTKPSLTMTKPPYFCCFPFTYSSIAAVLCKLRHRHQGLHLGLCSAERASKDVIQAAVAIPSLFQRLSLRKDGAVG